jgi:hypothetical protein
VTGLSTDFKAVKAWAFIFCDHLGRKEPRTPLTVHLDQMVARRLQRIKTLPCRSLPINPSPFHSSSSSAAAQGERQQRSRGRRSSGRWRHRGSLCHRAHPQLTGRAAAERYLGGAIRRVTRRSTFRGPISGGGNGRGSGKVAP